MCKSQTLPLSFSHPSLLLIPAWGEKTGVTRWSHTLPLDLRAAILPLPPPSKEMADPPGSCTRPLSQRWARRSSVTRSGWLESGLWLLGLVFFGLREVSSDHHSGSASAWSSFWAQAWQESGPGLTFLKRLKCKLRILFLCYTHIFSDKF